MASYEPSIASPRNTLQSWAQCRYPTPINLVLSLPETVARIISYVERKDLFSSALVCKCWSELALDRLWLEIDVDGEAIAKLKVLRRYWDQRDIAGSEGLGAVTGEKDEQNSRLVQTVVQPSLHQRWDRFRFYARRVRRLRFFREDEMSLFDSRRIYSTDDFSNLAASCPFPRIFPGLRQLSLDLTSDSNRSIKYASQYCCETLRCLSLSFQWSPLTIRRDELETLFRDITKSSPDIERLSIHNIYERALQDFGGTFDAFLLSLPRLKSLIIGKGDLTSRTFASIALLPSITTLEVRPIYLRKNGRVRIEEWRSFDLQLLSVLKPLQNPFPSLRSLKIMIRSGGIATLHASHVCFERLEELFILSTGEISDERLTDLFSEIALFRELKRLHVDLAGFSGRFTVQVFAPLSQLCGLTTLTIEHNVDSKMVDADLATLVKGIPTLVDLRLLIKSVKGTSLLTINALAALSRQQNRLRTLAFPLQTYRLGHEAKALNLDIDGIGTCLKELEELTFQRHGEAEVYLEREKVGDLDVFVRSCLGEECAKDVLAGVKVEVVNRIRSWT